MSNLRKRLASMNKKCGLHDDFYLSSVDEYVTLTIDGIREDEEEEDIKEHLESFKKALKDAINTVEEEINDL